MKLRDQLSSLENEIRRQAPYNEEFDTYSDEMSSAIVDIWEAVNKLDYVKELSGKK